MVQWDRFRGDSDGECCEGIAGRVCVDASKKKKAKQYIPEKMGITQHVIYLELLCGWTLEPAVTYKIKHTDYPTEVLNCATKQITYILKRVSDKMGGDSYYKERRGSGESKLDDQDGADESIPVVESSTNQIY